MSTWESLLSHDQQKAIRGWLSARGIDQSEPVELSSGDDSLVVPPAQ